MAFNVRVNEKSLRNVEANVRAVIDRVTNNVQMLNLVGQTIIDDVKYQTRLGRSIPNQMKPLAPFKIDVNTGTSRWVETRKRIAEAQKVSDVFKATRSNLTITGELLDSMEVVEAAKGKLKIDFEGTHSPYTATRKRGEGFRTIGKGIENKKLAKYVAENGRPFLGVRLALKQRLNRIVVGFIRRASKVYKLAG